MALGKAKRRDPEWLTDGFHSEVCFAFVGGGGPILRGCWFAGPGAGGGNTHHECEGPLQACHFIKRQTVEERAFWLVDDELDVNDAAAQIRELEALAAWDPRNGVPGCKHHHDRFDGHQGPPLVIPRILVPARVLEFVDDWDLQTALEDRCPT